MNPLLHVTPPPSQSLDVKMNTLRSTPEYLAEDNSTPLLGTSIAFLVLETIFMVLLYISRYLAKGERVNLSMEILMTMTYVVCISKIAIAFCMTFPPIHIYIAS